MGLYELQLSPLLLAVVGTVVYLFLFVLAFRGHRTQGATAISMGVYLLGALLVEASRIVMLMGWVDWLNPEVQALIDSYGAMLLALLLLQTLLIFLSHDNPWLFVAGLVGAAGVTYLQNPLMLFLAWVVFSGYAVFVVFRAFMQAIQPLHRSRLVYWMPVVALALANDIVIFYQGDLSYGTLRLLAASFLTFTILRHHMIDMRDMVRQFLIYFTTIVLLMGVYIGGFLVVQLLFEEATGYNALLVGASIALLISVLYTPLFNFVRSRMNRVFRVETYDPSEILRQYSISVSNILEVDKLATVSVGLLSEVLDINRGVLFLIDPELNEKGGKIYRLSGIRNGNMPTLKGSIAGESPVGLYLSEERKPLLQYDIDFAPAFITTDVLERKWLGSLDMDVYVPIIAGDEWIGMFALGPKSSGRRYTDEDLKMLTTIASQTGVALQNARLVENLKKLNTQIREAYTYLDKANHDLAKIESTKSNFISIASHELRTPLTVAKAYTEMLLENDTLDSAIIDILKGIHKSTLRQIEIMDSMFDIAQIDTRTLELHRQDVFITELLRSVVQEMAKLAAERQQELSVDLPQLPAITADPNALRKLFYHLITNAIKFTPNEGKITISGKQVQPNNRDLPEGGVEIIISDTGVGVDKGFQEIIFTKFYQPGELINRHSTGKTKFKGSGVGLGLALSRGIVEIHGGRIWVESDGYDDENYPGSDFHVILPLRSQSESKTVRMGSAVKLKL